MSKTLHLHADELSISFQPVAVIANPCPAYSLVNSVDYHPKKNLFCVTYTHGNRVVLYKQDSSGRPEAIQTLSNPLAHLSEPQHATFSPDGKKIIVANWTNQTLAVYEAQENDFFCAKPSSISSSPGFLVNHRPHGISISPCGNFLAVAYGAASCYERGIALFRISKEGMGCEFICILQGKKLPGIPKGITFSPDGTCLLVTFSDVNSLVIFNIDEEYQRISQTPRQIIQGKETLISHPEDVKITPDGNFCAITNSDQHTVTFYLFDKVSNRIIQSSPVYVLQSPLAQLCVPHGIAFSPDGAFIAITEFGHITATSDGDVSWTSEMRANEAKVSIFRIEGSPM